MRLAFLGLSAALALLPVPTLADALTLMGKLGSREIVVELTQPQDGAVAGRFAFMDTGGDIPLVPVSSDGKTWLLNEEAPCGEDDCGLDENGKLVAAPIAAVWQLTYDPETYIATGIRQSVGSKAKEQALELATIAWRPLGESEEATAFSLHDRSAQYAFMMDWPLDWSTAPYEMTLMDVPLKFGPETGLGGAVYHEVVDPRTLFAFPRILSFADGSSVEPANAILADRHARMNLAAFDCLAFRFGSYGMGSNWGDFGGHLGDYDQELVELSYASPRLVSWSQSGSLFCMGAHPYNHADSFTYDVATGKPLDLRQVFSAWVPREWGAAPDEVADTDLAFENPDAYHWGPSPELIAYVRDNLPPEYAAADSEMDDDCYSAGSLADQLDIRFGPGPSAIFTASGYPHIMSFCNSDLLTVPLAELGRFLAPTARDYFPELSD